MSSTTFVKRALKKDSFEADHAEIQNRVKEILKNVEEKKEGCSVSPMFLY